MGINCSQSILWDIDERGGRGGGGEAREKSRKSNNMPVSAFKNR